MRQFIQIFVTLIAVAGSNAFVSPMAGRTTMDPLQMTVLTYGNKKKNFKPGSPLSNACKGLGGKFTHASLVRVLS